jgi:hypothetical protein
MPQTVEKKETREEILQMPIVVCGVFFTQISSILIIV